ARARMLPGSMLKAPVCPTPIGCFTDNVEERFFILLIPPAITPCQTTTRYFVLIHGRRGRTLDGEFTATSAEAQTHSPPLFIDNQWGQH
ncbi:MAG: hypothetical protein ACI9VS_002255, partial [Candidatus Binatia bacterium]